MSLACKELIVIFGRGNGNKKERKRGETPRIQSRD
jgi:hypothetical protein